MENVDITCESILKQCKESGLRRTKALQSLICTLVTEKGITRRLGLHERAAYFTLLIPGRHQDFLICTSCGDIEPIKAACPVHALEKEIATKTGYANLYHELEFFGTCPKCC